MDMCNQVGSHRTDNIIVVSKYFLINLAKLLSTGADDKRLVAKTIFANMIIFGTNMSDN
jgi:hypothetical protein